MRASTTPWMYRSSDLQTHGVVEWQRPFNSKRRNTVRHCISTNFSGKREAVEIADDRTHNASPSSKVRLVWLSEDSQWPCGVLFPRAERVAFGQRSIEKVLGVPQLAGTGGEFDPDGPARIASAAIADAIRDRKKAYYRAVSQRKLTHRMRIPPELLQ